MIATVFNWNFMLGVLIGGSGFNSMFARLGTDYEIRNQWFFAILEAMTTDRDLLRWKCYGHLQRTINQREKMEIYFE